MAKQKKHNLKWIKETLTLKENHRWESKPGYRIFVANRGAVRIDVPEDWTFEPQERSFRFLDREPPNDDCCLELSFNPLPPGDFTGFPLPQVLQDIMEKDDREVLEIGPVQEMKRVALRLVWGELRFMDPNEHREAFSRIAIGLGGGIQCLITFDYWVADTERLLPVWDTVLETLKLGLYISDPTLGTARPD